MDVGGRRVLTREMLLAGGIERMIAEGAPGLRLLTEDERAASIAEILRERPDHGNGVWVFAYGSLIWNPAINYVTRRFARVYGWHRSFCLSTLAGRGSKESPGLVLGLDRGGACTGAAFLIAEEHLGVELPILWRREMVSGAYRPSWVAVRDETGAPFGQAIAFIIRRTGPFYAGALPEDEVVRRLATAEGGLGSCAEYLFQTRDGLRSLGITDRSIERLARKVEAMRQPAS